MTSPQERHLHRIKTEFLQLVDTKYRAGAKEHGGTLLDMCELKMLDSAIDEAIDQVVYLLSLREKMIERLGPCM